MPEIFITWISMNKKTYRFSNGWVIGFYVILIVLYLGVGLCLSQFKISVKNVPQTTYLIVIVGLLFLYTIMFLFMLFQYLCRKELSYIFILGIAFISCDIYFIETIYIVQALINDSVSIEQRSNDIAIFYYFRQLSFIITLCIGIKAYRNDTIVIEDKQKKPILEMITVIVVVAIGILAHNLSSYNPDVVIDITCLKDDLVTLHWELRYIYSLIAGWAIALVYLTLKTRLNNALWVSIALMCCSAILTNLLLITLDEYSMYIWYVSRGLEIISALCVISILMFNTFLLLKRETESSMRDALTKIYNRKLFYKTLNSAMLRGNVCVLMLDIDKFKRINDTYGHQEGDKVIVSIVYIINKSIRDSDVFARVGGEEFGILLKCNDKQEAMVVAERIRQNVEKLTLPPNVFGIKEQMTISIGVYFSSPKDESGDKVVSYADAALYAAKNAGRNKVMYYCGSHELTCPCVQP